MPDSITVLARAKVNLYLRVGPLRPDGYHELETVFHSISLADRLTVSLTSDRSMTLRGMPAVPVEKNLAVRAARALMARAGREGQGLAIELEKSIPVEAGLGGGSADAAATLVALNALLDLSLPADELAAIGATVGADVPFCVRGGLAIGRGIGERLVHLDPLQFHLVVVKPPVSVCTAEAFRALDGGRASAGQTGAERPPPAGTPADELLLEAADRGAAAAGRFAENSFESVVLPLHAEIARGRAALLDAGAAWAMLTGSGAAVFGVYPSGTDASTAARSLEAALPTFRVMTCRSAPRGVEIL